MATKEQLLKWAMEDYRLVEGRDIWVREFTGYVGDDSIDFILTEPVKARVRRTPETDIDHWVDEWLDPYWNIELLEIPKEESEANPDLLRLNPGSTWMFGDSYSLDDKYQPARFEPRIGPREWSPRGFERKRKR